MLATLAFLDANYAKCTFYDDWGFQSMTNSKVDES